MKVKIGPYPKHYTVCRLEDWWLTFHHGVDSLHIDETHYTSIDRVVVALLNGVQWVLNKTINRLNGWRSQKVRVHLDHYDTWNADYTLAQIILPVLEQLRDNSQSYPLIDPVDVPTDLKPTMEQLKTYKEEGVLDTKAKARWDYAINEMIFAFECIVDDSWEDMFFSWDYDSQDDLFHHFDKDGFNKYNSRIDNGLRLFGKYYRALWD